MADAPISDYTLYECPVGYYCLNGTEFSTQYACPAGTYNPSTRLEREDQCLDCPAGKYCETPGLDTWTGDCQAGYWCILASDSATPTDDVTGSECPEGKYCVEGNVLSILHPSKQVMQHHFDRLYQSVYGFIFIMLGIIWKLDYLSFHLYFICYDWFAGTCAGRLNWVQCQKINVANLDHNFNRWYQFVYEIIFIMLYNVYHLKAYLFFF